MVDLLGRHSNTTELAKRLKRAQALNNLQITPRPPTKLPRVHKIEQRLGPDLLDKIAAEYVAGATTPELMAIYKIGKGTVLGILRSRGVALRKQPLTPEQIERGSKLYRDGWSLKQVGAEIKVDAETVRQALKAAGIVMRKPWERRIKR